MKTPKFTALGPGDSETWPPFTGHPNDPRNDESEKEMTEDDRIELARDELHATPCAVADWLATECADDWDPLNVHRLARSRPFDQMTTPELFAIVMAANKDEAFSARCVLMDRFTETMHDVIKARADEIAEENRFTQE